ncbi:MAG: hypothetical protein C0418_02965 [Coriobacteriaceae bacterium]|nr:hypothetical protein [Coriobacteriaceae bacterium]
MSGAPKKLKSVLREHANRAWEAEMGAALGALAARFDDWRAGAMSAADLDAAVHEYHDGIAREIWKRYSTNDPVIPLAHAVVAGVLPEDSLPPEVVERIASMVQLLREEARGE